MMNDQFSGCCPGQLQAMVRIDKSQSKIDAGGDTCRTPDVAVGYKDPVSFNLNRGIAFL